MSTRIIRSISDFARHRQDVEIVCYCGHKASLPYWPVVSRFVDRGWPKSLDSALQRFKCSQCGGSPAHIGPLPR